MPVHIMAKEGDIAENVIVVGDPLRAKMLSQLLDNPSLVNENRCLLTYTGKWRGNNVTIATHGVGAPSAAIVFEELAQLGARNIVRLGTAGGVGDAVEVGSIVVGDSVSTYLGGCSLAQYFGRYIPPLAPSHTLLHKIIDIFNKHDIKYLVGSVFCSDAFYAETPELEGDLRRMGVLAIEMETGILYALARKNRLNALSILLVSNKLGSHEFLDKQRMEAVFKKIASLTLEALTL
ncbi:MAG: nucleoside phosphorylase [Desulfurococcales archaeon]|nr:nucleoside phosphorylase [Desulfurococcales archaeon]